ncbi:MAG: hypothetical protein J6X55_03690 [Victivallales bacterium]|nr:hypothetical protein [Victivallales bacterium]
MENKRNIQHVQTLVDMNHCVSIARRDAAYRCMMDFTTSTSGDALREDSIVKRLDAYDRCAALLREASMATKHATIGYDRQGLVDRPAVHILRLLTALMNTLQSLASHVYMVQGEAEILSDPLGAETYSLLVNTCRDFEANERMARYSFCEMLNVGRQLLETSSQNHKANFTEDETRRYNITYNEYVRLYSDLSYKFSKNIHDDICL